MSRTVRSYNICYCDAACEISCLRKSGQLSSASQRSMEAIEALAREIGVSWVTVQRWISGRTQPSPLATRRIQELIGEEDTSDS